MASEEDLTHHTGNNIVFVLDCLCSLVCFGGTERGALQIWGGGEKVRRERSCRQTGGGGSDESERAPGTTAEVNPSIRDIEPSQVSPPQQERRRSARELSPTSRLDTLTSTLYGVCRLTS